MVHAEEKNGQNIQKLGHRIFIEIHFEVQTTMILYD